MKWDDVTIAAMLLGVLVACEGAACVALVIILARRARRKWRGAARGTRGFDVVPSGDAPRMGASGTGGGGAAGATTGDVRTPPAPRRRPREARPRWSPRRRGWRRRR